MDAWTKVLCYLCGVLGGYCLARAIDATRGILGARRNNEPEV